MPEIKPDEISAILRQQLSNFNATADLEEVGTVLQIGDGIARVYGLGNVRYGELVEFENGVRAIALNLEEDNVGVVLMGETGVPTAKPVAFDADSLTWPANSWLHIISGSWLISKISLQYLSLH